jgi:hypothetical protein
VSLHLALGDRRSDFYARYLDAAEVLQSYAFDPARAPM